MAGDSQARTPSRPRIDRRPLKTRAALIEAAQQLIAEGRQNVAVLEITQLAGVGLGSFYNHFDSKEQLYQVALDQVLDTLGDVLDALTDERDDPAGAFAQSFRLTGRAFRVYPQLSRVILRSGVELIHSDTGLAPRARRDIAAAAARGRFQVEDVDLAVTLAAGAVVALGVLLENQPERDDASSTDTMVQGLLRAFGMSPGEAATICRAPLPDLGAGPLP